MTVESGSEGTSEEAFFFIYLFILVCTVEEKALQGRRKKKTKQIKQKTKKTLFVKSSGLIKPGAAPWRLQEGSDKHGYVTSSKKEKGRKNKEARLYVT